MAKTLTINLIKDDVFLKPISYEIPEIIIHNEDKTIEIGRVKKQIISYYYGADNGFAYMIGRFFNFEDEYTEAPLLKSIEILTDSDIENAQFNIRLYKVDSTGQPDQPIHNMNIFGFAAKGTNKTKIDLEKLYLQFPEDGLFVAIEWLQIDQNMFEWSYKSSESQKIVKMVSLEPSFAVENDQKKGNGWTYDGKWRISSGFSRLLHMKIILRN